MSFQLDVMDLRNILDYLSFPCLLVNVDSAKIETANYLLTEISGYTLDEIRTVDLSSLFTGIDSQSVVDGSSVQSQLIRKLDTPLSVEISFKFLGNTGNLLLVSFQKKGDNGNPNFVEVANQILVILSDLQKTTKAGLFEKILDVLIESKFADDLAGYTRADSQEPYLRRFGSTKGSSLPLEIPALELERMIQLDIWQPGRRVLSEIHRAGRDKKYLCIYSQPIRDAQKSQAILVFGYQSESHNDQREKSIRQISQLITIIINFGNVLFDLQDEMAALSSTIENFSAGFENTSEGILVLDASNNILDFNTTFTNIFHYTPMEIKNKNFSRIFGNSEADEIIKFSSDTSRQLKKKTITLVDRKGLIRFLDISYIPLVEEDSGKKMLIFHDKSENENLHRSIEHLENQAAIGETLAEFAHDARNIINRQATGIQLLARKLNLPNDENKEILGLLEDCDNLSEMMESVLSFSRQDSGSFEVIDLGDFIQGVIYRNKFKAEKSGVKVRFNNRLIKSQINGYQRSLERVLLNLINNAIDATRSEEGTVSITLLSEDSNPGQAAIKIADTGSGIPENLANVLLASQYTDKTSGTGLGLLISNKIIEAHQGRLKMDSFAGGTIFSIYLPLIEQGEEN